MSNLEQKYALLEDDIGSEHESQDFDHSSPKTTRKSRSTILLAGWTLFWVLNCCFRLMDKLEKLERTEFAGPKCDIPVPWSVYGPFDNRSDPEATDEEWEKKLVIYVLDLHKAQRFPWDESKGVYFINAYHNLYCLLKLRTSLLEFHRGEDQSGSFAHVTHCLDALRQDIKFNADDTPLWSGYGHRITGVDQIRMCRNWDLLDEWSKTFPSCWNKIPCIEDINERFSYCPVDSPYADQIIEILGSKHHLVE
ncbi:hypothetical protein BCON_0695g00030 [Botryotinia convoluta]|uniref:DUF3328 domain-containing protein n=1 Tax=Botryotinia convoluta TaxID=54673 RepID=A0A4Z1H494_9HELO|nr:hypothetical protein BCON_0695g00030 [Botryotinia convoluta]